MIYSALVVLECPLRGTLDAGGKVWKWRIRPPSLPGVASFHSRCCIILISPDSLQIIPRYTHTPSPATLAAFCSLICYPSHSFFFPSNINLAGSGRHRFIPAGENKSAPGSNCSTPLVISLSKRLILLHWAGLNGEEWQCQNIQLVILKSITCSGGIWKSSAKYNESLRAKFNCCLVSFFLLRS